MRMPDAPSSLRRLLLATLVAGGSILAPILAKEIEVTLQTVSEDAIQGHLIAFSFPGGAVLRRGSDEQRIATQDLVRITALELVRPSQPRGMTLTLTGGDRLRGRLVDAHDDTLVLETEDLGRLTLRLEAVRKIDSAEAASPAYQGSVAWLDRQRFAGDDRVLLTNGDLLEGFVTAVDKDGVSIEGALGEMRVPHRVVLAVRLNAGEQPATSGPYLTLTLRESGRVTVTGFEWSGEAIQAQLRHGPQVRLDPGDFARIDVFGGRWEWLSAHQPISSEHTPMLGLDWPPVRDRNVQGDPIAVAGETFERGIGVHSRSALTYDLKSAYQTFVTSFGLDDHSGPYADVTVFVLVDGKRRFDQANVRRGTLFGPVRLDVTQAKRIELIVEFGENGDLQDRFNWVETAVIR